MLLDIGNLITLGIVILLLILFRLLDRSNRSLDKVRKYIDRCKEDITVYIEEKAAVIKDYGIALEVERKAAMELMRRIQVLTREELAQKVQALTQIDERIQLYDASLEELVQMTGRVQENLNRIRDESSFVENVGKRVNDIKDKVESAENEIGSIGEKLVTIEQRFEQENTAALQKGIDTALSAARSAILDLEASAQTIERKVARDEDRIEKLLTEAINRAGSRADKIEEAALTKLREQAQERLNLIKASFEEKINAVQDQFKQMSGFADDTTRLEAELRQSMQEVTNRINIVWENNYGEFNDRVETIRDELRGIDRELLGIKEKSFENVSMKLKGFEDDFLANLSQRSAEIDSKLAAWQQDLDKKLESTAKDTIRQSQRELEAHMRDMEDTSRRNRELVGENNEHITAARSSLDEMRKEITAQIKLFERTDTLKAELDRHVQDMSGNIERLTQLKNEITRFETQLTQIKRLEDEINTKMTRFLSEKHRIEVMENDFNRLLQTSHLVEEKLAQVSNSDDILQTIQVKIRRLEDVITETDEKYKRMERKSNTLQETNDGIDRNFRTMQEEEVSVKRMSDTVALLQTEMDSIQKSVEILSSENEKARDAAEKLSTLDDSVKWLEKRIAEMNVAREGLARLATELQNLDKDAQTQLKLTRSLLDREAGKTAARAGKAADEGAPPPRDRENIINLKRKGWSIDEIARTMNISRGEVELILELGPKDT